MDRVKDCEVPGHRKDWFQWMEEVVTFDLEDEIRNYGTSYPENIYHTFFI